MVERLFKRWSTFNEIELALHGIFVLCFTPIFLWAISGWLMERIETDLFDGFLQLLLLVVFLSTFVKGAIQAARLPLLTQVQLRYRAIDRVTLKVFVGGYFGVVTVFLAIYTLEQLQSDSLSSLMTLVFGLFIMVYMFITLVRSGYLFIVARESLSIRVTDVHLNPKLYTAVAVLFAFGTCIIFFTVHNIVLVFLIPFTVIAGISFILPKGSTFEL